MPIAAARTLSFSPEDYFAWEETQDIRHEYHFGEVFPMPGGTFEHAALIANLTIALGVALRGTDCRVLSEAMRVQILSGRQYVYPDVTVVCGDPAFYGDRRTALVNPTVVCEVLSPETAAYDRGEKLALYRGVPSVQAVVYADPDRPWVQVARRTGDTWARDEPITHGPIVLSALEVTLPLGDLYAGL